MFVAAPVRFAVSIVAAFPACVTLPVAFNATDVAPIVPAVCVMSPGFATRETRDGALMSAEIVRLPEVLIEAKLPTSTTGPTTERSPVLVSVKPPLVLDVSSCEIAFNVFESCTAPA